MENQQACACKHHKVVPMCIMLIGFVFLLGEMNIFTSGFVSIIWPILLIVIGATKMAKCKCC